MTEKPMMEKERAHMLFKRHKAGMVLSEDEQNLMMRYYGHILILSSGKVIPELL